jgi:hypothetical protein
VFTEGRPHRTRLSIGPQRLKCAESTIVIRIAKSVQILMEEKEGCVSRPILGQCFGVNIDAADICRPDVVRLTHSFSITTDGMKASGISPQAAERDAFKVANRKASQLGQRPHRGDDSLGCFLQGLRSVHADSSYWPFINMTDLVCL